jgi:hypothetical protein
VKERKNEITGSVNVVAISAVQKEIQLSTRIIYSQNQREEKIRWRI